jgi:hypothetical protein
VTDRQALQTAARAAKHAAGVEVERGETDEAAISQLMSDRYTRQLTDKEN